MWAANDRLRLLIQPGTPKSATLEPPQLEFLPFLTRPSCFLATRGRRAVPQEGDCGRQPKDPGPAAHHKRLVSMKTLMDANLAPPKLRMGSNLCLRDPRGSTGDARHPLAPTPASVAACVHRCLPSWTLRLTAQVPANRRFGSSTVCGDAATPPLARARPQSRSPRAPPLVSYARSLRHRILQHQSVGRRRTRTGKGAGRRGAPAPYSWPSHGCYEAL